MFWRNNESDSNRMKLNIELNINKETEPQLLEYVQSTLLFLNVMSDTHLNTEYVDNCDDSVTIRLNEYEITEETINKMNMKTS